MYNKSNYGVICVKKPRSTDNAMVWYIYSVQSVASKRTNKIRGKETARNEDSRGEMCKRRKSRVQCECETDSARRVSTKAKRNEECNEIMGSHP